jgi:hypothetical protein
MTLESYKNVSSLRFNPGAGVHALWLNLWALIAGFFMAGDRGPRRHGGALNVEGSCTPSGADCIYVSLMRIPCPMV